MHLGCLAVEAEPGCPPGTEWEARFPIVGQNWWRHRAPVLPLLHLCLQAGGQVQERILRGRVALGKATWQVRSLFCPFSKQERARIALLSLCSTAWIQWRRRWRYRCHRVAVDVGWPIPCWGSGPETLGWWSPSVCQPLWFLPHLFPEGNLVLRRDSGGSWDRFAWFQGLVKAWVLTRDLL